MSEGMERRPLSDFSAHPQELADELKRSRLPLVLTVEGRPELVVQDATGYAELLQRLQELELTSAIEQGLEDVKAGRVRQARQALEDLGNRLGLSS